MTPRVAVILPLVVTLGGIAWVLFAHLPWDDQVVVHRFQPTLTAADEAAGTNDINALSLVKSPKTTYLPPSKPRSSHPAKKPGPAQRAHRSDRKARVSILEPGRQQIGTQSLSAVSIGSSPSHVSIPSRQDVSQMIAAQNVPPTNEENQLQPNPMETPPPSVSPVARAAVIQPPSLITGTLPAYPEGAYHLTIDRSSLLPNLQSAAAEGRVVLRLFVLGTGRVGRVTVAVSSGFEILDQAAVSAAEFWQFAPATRDGLPIEAWALIPVRFVLK